MPDAFFGKIIAAAEQGSSDSDSAPHKRDVAEENRSNKIPAQQYFLLHFSNSKS